MRWHIWICMLRSSTGDYVGSIFVLHRSATPLWCWICCRTCRTMSGKLRTEVSRWAMFQAMCHTLFTAAASPFAKSSPTGSEASQLASVGLGYSIDCYVDAQLHQCVASWKVSVRPRFDDGWRNNIRGYWIKASVDWLETLKWDFWQLDYPLSTPRSLLPRLTKIPAQWPIRARRPPKLPTLTSYCEAQLANHPNSWIMYTRYSNQWSLLYSR